MRVTSENVEDLFAYHKPEADQLEAFEKVREAGVNLVKVILEYVPECADRTVAIRKVREVRMDANQAIALRGAI